MNHITILNINNKQLYGIKYSHPIRTIFKQIYSNHWWDPNRYQQYRLVLMAIKEYSTITRSPKAEPHYPIQFSLIHRKPFLVGFLPLHMRYRQTAYSKPHRQGAFHYNWFTHIPNIFTCKRTHIHAYIYIYIGSSCLSCLCLSMLRGPQTYIQQLCANTWCSLEDLPGAMGDRNSWHERVREIRTSSTTWWWWW